MSKILISTDAINLPSGQGRVGREIAKGLVRHGHDVGYLGWFQLPRISTIPPDGIKYWWTNNNLYGSDVLDQVVMEFQPDILLTVGDFWNIGYIADMNICRTRRTFQWCFKGDTEVVTKSGVKNIKDITVGDFVLSVSPTGKVSYKRVMATQRPWFEGNLVNIRGKYVDFSVTPDHRFLMKPTWKKEYEWITAEVLRNGSSSKLKFPAFSPVSSARHTRFNVFNFMPDDFDIVLQEENLQLFSEVAISTEPRHHASPKTFNIKVADAKALPSFAEICDSSIPMPYIKGKIKDKSRLPAILEMGDFLELAGWFIAEGSVERGACNRIQISQQEENKFEISYRRNIRSLLDRMGLNYREKFSGFTIAGLPIVELMSLFGDKSGNKKLPEWVFDLSHEELEKLFRSMMMGDGSRTGELYCTVSEQLKKDFMRLCFHLGYAASEVKNGVSVRKLRNRNSISSKHISEEPFYGFVHCVTVEENGTLLAGRNGKFQFTGNCSYIPVDGEPMNGGIPPAIKPIIEDIDIPVAYTEYAKSAVLKSVFDQETRNRIRVIYHGVDTDIFRPIDPKERRQIRDNLGIGDKFLFLTVSRNQSRKNIPQLLKAWKKFSEIPETQGNVLLWPHMNFNDPMGWKIQDVLEILNLRNHSIMYYQSVANASHEMQLLPDTELAKLYQVADAFILLSGEGFGLPTFEAMATKLPCILLDHSASGELGANQRAELVPTESMLPLTGPHLTQRPLLNPDRAYESMLKIFKDREYRTFIAENGYKFATQFTWKKVTDDWNLLFTTYEVPFIKPLQLEVIS